MSTLLFLRRLLPAAALCIVGVAKLAVAELADLAGSRRAVREFAVPAVKRVWQAPVDLSVAGRNVPHWCASRSASEQNSIARLARLAGPGSG
jgi:hypothetical protein